jgi:hypothetical protein
MKIPLVIFVATTLFLIIRSANCVAQNDSNRTSTLTANENRTAVTSVSAPIGPEDINADDAKRATDQPWLATGLDLKGPPRQFPPDKTPGIINVGAY